MARGSEGEPWRLHGGDSLFRLDDGLELENWDVLHTEGESAERQLNWAQEMLSTAAASVAGALGALTHEMVPTGQVRARFALAASLFPCLF